MGQALWRVGEKGRASKAEDQEEVTKIMPKSWEDGWFCGPDTVFLCDAVEILPAPPHTLFP